MIPPIYFGDPRFDHYATAVSSDSRIVIVACRCGELVMADGPYILRRWGEHQDPNRQTSPDDTEEG